MNNINFDEHEPSKRQVKQLDYSAITNFIPWFLKGVEHFYGKENINFAQERLANVIFFPYFSESKNNEAIVDEQLKILFAKLEAIDSEPLPEDEIQSATENLKTSILENHLQSGCSIEKSTTKGIIPIVLIDMFDYLFYPRLIHELIHAIDGNIINEVQYSGFEITKNQEKPEHKMFNEYFTDKIAIDIYNWLIEQNCPLLNGLTQIHDRSLGNGGVYWAPDAFMNPFYQAYKKEICNCKLKNSHKIFVDILGKDNTQKIMDSCDLIASSFHMFASDEEFDRALAAKNECKQIILSALEKNQVKF